MLVEYPWNLVERFEYYECDFIMGNTLADWPADIVTATFESTVAPWSHQHAHGSAGWHMARVKEGLAILEEAADIYYRLEAARQGFDDQRELRKLHMLHYPRMKVDTLALLMSRADGNMGQL